ncbi:MULTISPECIES: hypothetical protein [unclassified Bradyrhizobium]|uniref:hypothetical protein n=1 Tax=unclassified Bradyrhizobium TaxID=2631580 RepID=UPI0029162B82|nr:MULTISPECIES: hypothetical protein [unclassified Bradyrhizobium]
MKSVELISRFGSPAYVYELARVREAHSALRAALPQSSDLYYSLKANPHPAIASELARVGCWAEVSSLGEMKTALNAGFVPSRCLYTGPGKTEAEMRAALGLGRPLFSVDSPWDLAKLASASKAAGVQVDALLRINPDTAVPGMGLSMCGAPSPFGADTRWVLDNPAAFRTDSCVSVVGLHFYMGTNLPTTDLICRATSVALVTARELIARGFAFDIIDLGGGFGHPFGHASRRPDFPGLRTAMEAMLDDFLPMWRSGCPKIMFESGRYLTASAGHLLATVQDIKQSKGTTFVVLDSGVNHLGGMAGLRRVPNVGLDFASIETSDERLLNANLVGPLCTPLDVLARGAILPDLTPGDVIEIPNVGAYGLTASLLAFLSHDAPVEIVLDAGAIVDVSRLAIHRQSTAYLDGDST